MCHEVAVSCQFTTTRFCIASSQEQVREFQHWQEYDNEEENFCEMECKLSLGGEKLACPMLKSVCVPILAEFSFNASYVDLLLNPEGYTGYSGHSTKRIWSAIYIENCFRCAFACMCVYVHACVCLCVSERRTLITHHSILMTVQMSRIFPWWTHHGLKVMLLVYKSYLLAVQNLLDRSLRCRHLSREASFLPSYFRATC